MSLARGCATKLIQRETAIARDERPTSYLREKPLEFSIALPKQGIALNVETNASEDRLYQRPKIKAHGP
jgi:hypothetical protein